MSEPEAPNRAIYETPDYRLAGFLLARGVEHKGTRREGKRTIFIFEGPEAFTERLIDEFPGSAERRYDGACKAMHALTATKKR